MTKPYEKELPAGPWLSVRGTGAVARVGRGRGDESQSSGAARGHTGASTLGARLFERARMVIEGGTDASPLCDNDYAYASVMLTIEVSDLPLAPGDRADTISAQRWASQLARDCDVRACLLKLAGQKIEEILGSELGDQRIELDLRARAEGTRILIDADAMVSLPASTENRFRIAQAGRSRRS